MPDNPDSAFETRVRDSFASQGFMRLIGAEITSLSPGCCIISAPIHENVSQQHGFAHAGLTFSIGDSAAGYAALSLMPANADVLTAEIKINLMSPAVGTHLRAEGRVIRPGRRLMTVESLIFAYEGATRGKQVAQMLGTMVTLAD